MSSEATLGKEIAGLVSLEQQARELLESSNVFVAVGAQRVLTIVQDLLFELDPSIDLPWQPSEVAGADSKEGN